MSDTSANSERPENTSPRFDFERIRGDLKALKTALNFQQTLLQDLEEALQLPPAADQS